MNVLTQFLMFACASFVSMLTGNSFAMVGLSVLFHFILTLITAALSVMADCFLYGFSNTNTVLNRVFSSSFVTWLIESADGIFQDGVFYIEIGRLFLYLAISVVLYILGGLLYKKRNLETAEDVAGFKCLNPIFKYLATFMGAIGAFAVFSSFITEKSVIFWLVIVLVSAVIYFAAEMILKKTLKVFTSYKGFLGFLAGFFLMTALFAFTSFFGFETYVPPAEDVESVAVYNYYHNREEPYIKNPDVIQHVTALHREFTEAEDMYTIRPDYNGEIYRTRIHIKYKLKNGREVARAYLVSVSEQYEISDSLYTLGAYKTAMERVLSYDSACVYNINYHFRENTLRITERSEIDAFYQSLKQDIAELSYREIYHQSYGVSTLDFEYIPEHDEDGRRINVDYVSCSINRNFKHTLNWLRENGYGAYADVPIEETLYISRDMSLTKSLREMAEESAELTEPVFPEKGIAAIKDSAMKEKLKAY
ncbi:MAG: hypothetical protein IKL80_03395, partial [Clostridia bacterium]|nr:hypothetical protein [Clostridia bacterium]